MRAHTRCHGVCKRTLVAMVFVSALLQREVKEKIGMWLLIDTIFLFLPKLICFGNELGVKITLTQVITMMLMRLTAVIALKQEISIVWMESNREFRTEA